MLVLSEGEEPVELRRYLLEFSERSALDLVILNEADAEVQIEGVGGFRCARESWVVTDEHVANRVPWQAYICGQVRHGVISDGLSYRLTKSCHGVHSRNFATKSGGCLVSNRTKSDK